MLGTDACMCHRIAQWLDGQMLHRAAHAAAVALGLVKHGDEDMDLIVALLHLHVHRVCCYDTWHGTMCTYADFVCADRSVNAEYA